MEEMVTLFLPFFIFISYFRPRYVCLTTKKQSDYEKINDSIRILRYADVGYGRLDLWHSHLQR